MGDLAHTVSEPYVFCSGVIVFMLKSIKHEKGGVIFRLCGEITSEEIIDARTEARNREDLVTSKYHLWIFESVKDFKISTAQIKQMAIEDIELSKEKSKMKIAIASDSSLAFGLSRMYEMFADECEWEMMVFNDIEEAKSWVNS